MKLHIQRYLAEISTEIERVEKLETALAQSNERLETIDRNYDAMVQSFKKLKIYTDLEAERDDLRKELTNLKTHRKLEAERAEVIRAGEEASWHNLNLVNVKLEKDLASLREELEAYKAKPKTPTHYWEVTVKLRDGRLGTYAILDWPRNIKADEVFRDDVTLSLHRVVS